MTMADARAIWHWHLTVGGIQGVALSEALDVLHRAMCPTLYCRIRMAIKIASDLPAFFVVIDFVVADNLR